MINWYLQNGKDSDVVISSRIRLARNLADFPFKEKAKTKDLEQVLKTIKEITPSIGYNIKYIEILCFCILFLINFIRTKEGNSPYQKHT